MPVIEEAPAVVKEEQPPGEDQAVMVRMREVVREQRGSPALKTLKAETKARVLAFGDENFGSDVYGW